MATKMQELTPPVRRDLNESEVLTPEEQIVISDVIEMANIQTQMKRLELRFEKLKEATRDYCTKNDIAKIILSKEETLARYGTDVTAVEASVQLRKERTIDAKKYFDLVTREEFFASCKISVKEAELKLAEKDFKKCMTLGWGTPAFSVKIKEAGK